MRRFVEKFYECRWVDTYQRFARDGPMCWDTTPDAGAPTDTGPAPDLGSADAGPSPDAAPNPDAMMGGGGICECPLPSRELSHCEMM